MHRVEFFFPFEKEASMHFGFHRREYEESNGYRFTTRMIHWGKY